MKDLIEALTIMLKYGDVSHPTNCEHDMLRIFPAVEPSAFTPEELARLEEIGFIPGEEGIGGFYSFRYGSC